MNMLLHRIKNKISLKKKIIKLVIYIALVSALCTLIYHTYNEYKKNIVYQQQQSMLGISRSISQSIDLFINDVRDSVKVMTLDKEFSKGFSNVSNDVRINICKEKLKAYYEAEKRTVDAVYAFDKDGNMITQYPQDNTNTDINLESNIDAVLKTKEPYIGMVYLDERKNVFILNIYEPILLQGEVEGVVSVAISLDLLYDRLIDPVKIGEKGYAMVKDQYGTIIMHPVKEQVGIDVIETRKEMHPNLEFRELENLIDKQLTGEEGVAIYHSYWWGDNLLKKVKKLSAYTPVELGDHFWVVALTMSYDEIQGPINKFSSQIIGIAIIIAIIIYTFIAALIKMKRNKEELEKETKYLKALNETSEQLRKKEAELYHSHKLRMIGTLAGGIAHDINNLLTPILGYSELLLMRMTSSSEYYEEVDEIYKASQKGKDLIEQILLFSRKDNGIIKVEPIKIDEVIKATIKLLKAVIPKKVLIEENINKYSVFVNANFTQIHQVVFNLCTNAYQSMKDNSGVIAISLNTVHGIKVNEIHKELSKEKDYAEIIITDTGCGMDEETKERIFDPFFTTKTIGEGTGLGLFVVQSIIQKYDGNIFVDSEAGKGSSFKVYLPLTYDMVNGQKEDKSETNLAKCQKILLVDDNEDVIKVLKKGLEHLDYKVVAEKNSKKAIEIFKQEHENIDIVITDYMMPELNGGALAMEVKKIKKDVRVILITGFMDENKDIINDSKAVDAYILKPVEITNLSKVIRELLDI